MRGLLLSVCIVMLKAAAFAQQPLVLWDNKPAADWMTGAYPIGNGRIGGMVFGNVGEERIQLNELSLWTGDEEETGAYQNLGDLFIRLEGVDTLPTKYTRQLDLRKAVQQVNYSADNTTWQREYFCSFPGNVMVIRFTAANKGRYNATIRLKDAHKGQITAAAAAAAATITMNGKLENGLAYEAGARVLTEKGSVTAVRDGDSWVLAIKKANSFTILLSAATDYSNQRAQHWRGEAPGPKVKQALDAAAAKTYDQLLQAHIKDYQELFNRVAINLGVTGNDIRQLPTAQRLINNAARADHELEALQFQYGRYLLISSSRKGGLPANLQGIWNDSNTPPWRCDYHSNINVQMNYWLAEPANLAECAVPYLDYINSMREVKKESTRKEYPGVRGWTVKTENNIFGGSSFKWNTPGSAWYMQGIWDHYAFSKDTAYLRNFAYPILKEIVNFWDDHLKRRPDGTLVAPLGWSPEHGPTEDGVTHDQEIVYDLFTNYIEAADALHVDPAYRDHVEDMRKHLLAPKIGRWGQLQEWETDRDDPADKHRHASHLFALHPGRQISVTQTPALAQAAKVSLEARGDASTGWSMAWKMNFWARLQDGDHAYRILRNFFRPVGNGGVNYDYGGGLYPNLFCAHPPFQIDGNLGYVAAVTEMLLQSQAGEIQLLPALPQSWSVGEVQGLRARGNVEITDLQWENGVVKQVSIRANSGGEIKLRTPNALNASGAAQSSDTSYLYSFPAAAGKVYTFTAAAQPYPSAKNRLISPGNTTYYIDPVNGNDEHTGKQPEQAWKSFLRLNQLILQAGDAVQVIAPGAFHQSLALMTKGTTDQPVKVNFAPGRYDFFPDHSLRRALHISNTNDLPWEPKAIALLLDSCESVQVSAAGATIMLRGKMIETFVNGGHDISLNGLTYDYHRPTVSELSVRTLRDHYADVAIHPDSKYSISDSTLSWLGEGWSYQPGSYWQVLDPATNDLSRMEIQTDKLRFVAQNDSIVRIYFQSNPGFQPGFTYQNRDVTRDCAGIFLRNSQNISLKNIHIHFMHGMGVVSQYCKDVHIDSMTVKPAEGSGRTCAAWADILHFSGCSGQVIVENGELTAANDDAINIHGTHLQIQKIIAPNQVQVKFMHPQTYGFDAFAPQDEISFIHPATLLAIGEDNQVSSVQQLDEKEYILTLKKPLPADVKAGDAVENATATPEVMIQNMAIARIPTRGMLVTTRRRVIIENNRFFRTHMSAIAINDDAANWFESGMVQEMTILSNTFRQCGEPAIVIHPENAENGKSAVHRNFSVRYNMFFLQGAGLISAKSVDNMWVKNNIIRTPADVKDVAALVELKDCTNIAISDNRLLPLK